MVCVVVVSSFVLLEAAATVTGTTSFDYGNFTSEYVQIQSSSITNWYTAVDACRACGTGWDIAGIYSSGGNAAIQTMFSTTVGVGIEGYIGGYYPSPSIDVAPNLLLWYGGRFSGTSISEGTVTPTCLGLYCNFRPSEPSASACTQLDGNITFERALQIYSEGTWNDVPPEGCPTNVISNVICERSACSIQVDCVTANTASISGVYAPSCTCTCKTGYRGAKCQVIDTTVTANGTSYGAWCEASPMNASVAEARCVGQGSGWTLASIPTSGVDAMIRGLTNDTMWTGGTYVESADNYKWQFGRWGDLYFSGGPNSTGACADDMYCNWNPGQPDRADCLDGSPLEKDVVVWGSEWSVNQQWDDLWSNGCGLQNAHNVNCYVCERSACSITIDCVAANTVSVAGAYYPSCVCTCKSGFAGSMCEVDTTIITVGNMEYSVLCDSTYINCVTAQANCVAKGESWTLASVTSSAVNTALANSAPNQNIWIGARYNATYNGHEWMYGRQAGKAFSKGLKSSVTCQPGMYCNWILPQPDQSVCGDDGPQIYVVIWGKKGITNWDDTFTNGCGKPLSLTSCYACERSPCLQSDCAKGYTRPRGYYPCVCSTISATLSLSTTTSISLTSSLSLTTTISSSTTMSLPITSTISPTLTASASLSLSGTSSLSVSSSISTSATSTLSQSISFSHTSTQLQSTSVTLSDLTASPTTTQTTSPSGTTTITKSLSATGLSGTTTRTEEHTESSTYAANTTLVAEMLAQFPLFTVVVDDNIVRSGSTRSLTPIHISTALWELLAEAGARRVRVTGIPIVAAVPALGPVGVTGNEKGFYFAQPNTTLLMSNHTTLNLTLSALPQYSITVGERLLLYTSMRELLDVVVLTDHRDVDELHLVGTIVVSKPDSGMTGPSIVTTVVTSVGGTLGGMASELQGVGALALMGCSDPITKSRFGSYRVLSPVAVQDSYAGVIMGNALLACAVGLVQLAVVLVLRFCRRVQRRVVQMAAARFPSFFIAAALAFHTGTAFASAQLVSQPGKYAAWEVFVGVAGLLYSLVLPVAMAAHPYLRVGRAYQEYSMTEWLGARRWPAWIVWVLPRGALFSLETRRAYGHYLSAYRAPPRQVLWTSLPTWTSLVFLVAGLFHPNTVPECQAQFACMGIAMVFIAVLVVWRAPLRAHMAGWLDAASRLTLGCVMFCMAAAIVEGERLNAHASDAAFAFDFVLMAITGLRVLHNLMCMYTDNCMERDLVPLETAWTHVPGTNRNKTLQFHMKEDDSLQGIADDRDEVGDVEVELNMPGSEVVIDTPLVEDEDGFDTDDFFDDEEELGDVEVGDDDEPRASEYVATAITTPPSRPQYSGIAAFRDSSDEANDGSDDFAEAVPPGSESTGIDTPISVLESSSSFHPTLDGFSSSAEEEIRSIDSL